MDMAGGSPDLRYLHISYALTVDARVMLLVV